MSWRKTQIAAARTHHERDGVPLYAERFDEVLKFHEPGLAAVRQGQTAWHIDTRGQPAYEARFSRTFGFYEGLAAVVDPRGFVHIRADGSCLYPERYAFAGNFQQDRCPVRDHAGRAWHINGQGRACYPARYRYVGDFRDGIAVVQREDGRSTHIDAQGALLHGRWFADLDVYHKGLARARDVAGWTHVDLLGRPAYGRRFAMVEPFYNGQARVEREDGALEVIDESGTALVELRPPTRSELHRLSADLVGSWRTDTIAAAVSLGVFQTLPGSAPVIGVPEEHARRLLRALGELGLVERAGENWVLTPRGEYLRSEHPQSLADAALAYAGPLRGGWTGLSAALRGQQTEAKTIFTRAAADLELRRSMHRMLRSYALHDYADLVSLLPVLASDHVIDAGGGTGALAELLIREHDGLMVTVFDLPEIVAMVGEIERVRTAAGDLFARWPVQGDVVVLARVLHDWDDQAAASILRRAREAMSPGGRLCLIELLLDKGGYGGGLCDLHLLAVTGGQERTADELARLMDSTGFGFQEIRRSAGVVPSVILGQAR